MTCQGNCKYPLCLKSTRSIQEFQDRLEKYLKPEYGELSKQIAQFAVDDLTAAFDKSRWDCLVVEEVVKKFAEVEGDIEIGIPLLKYFEDTDGGIITYGQASGPEEDHDGEIVDQPTLKSLFDGYMQNPVMKYMHGRRPNFPDAVGKALQVWRNPVTKKVYRSEFTDDGPQILAKVSSASDLEPIRTRIKEEIIKGYSIGGKSLKKVKEFNKLLGRFTTRLFAKAWTETSYVDTPSYKKAFFTVIYKRAGDGAEDISLEPGENEDNESIGRVQRAKKKTPRRLAREGTFAEEITTVKLIGGMMNENQSDRLETIEKNIRKATSMMRRKKLKTKAGMPKGHKKISNPSIHGDSAEHF